MVENTPTKKFLEFNLGLNYRDDELELREGETPLAYNNDVTRSGIASILGFTNIWNKTVDSKHHIRFFDEYTDDDGKYRWIAVSYPNVLLINPENGAVEEVYKTWYNTGVPFGRQVRGDYILVDGTPNPPLKISKRTVTEISWPPVFGNANNASGDPGNIIDSYLNQSSAQQPSDTGNPMFFAYHKNRIIMVDSVYRRRLYFSKLTDITDFSDNDPNVWDIAFFVDLPIAKPITALQVLSNEFLVIHCEGQMLVMSGDNPPGLGYDAPHFYFDVLNSTVGALHFNLVAPKGDNDHYFVANNGRIYTLISSDDFRQARPKGLTSKIFPFFQGIDNETLKRGKLLNHEIKSELVFWLPSSNTRRYPDQQLVLHYDISTSEPVWSLRKFFGDQFRFKGAIVDKKDRMIICKDGTKFLEAHKGTSFDGEPIELVYQLPTTDFDYPNHTKNITRVVAYGGSPTGSGANLYLSHLWDSGKESLTPFTFASKEPGLFDDLNTLFDTTGDNFTSDTGLAFQKKSFRIANRYGKRLKTRIEHRSTDTNVVLSSLALDYSVGGKG